MPKLLIFGINYPKVVYPLKKFLRNVVWGREFQIHYLTPNFTIVIFKMWTSVLKNHQKW